MEKLNANRDEIMESNVNPEEFQAFNMDEVTSPKVKFDEQGHEYIFTGWRIDSLATGKIDPKTRQPEKKPYLYLDCVSIDGIPSTKYVQSTSVRLNDKLAPIINGALQKKQGQIRVFIKKILGWNEDTDMAEPMKNDYEVKDLG